MGERELFIKGKENRSEIRCEETKDGKIILHLERSGEESIVFKIIRI